MKRHSWLIIILSLVVSVCSIYCDAAGFICPGGGGGGRYLSPKERRAEERRLKKERKQEEMRALAYKRLIIIRDTPRIVTKDVLQERLMDNADYRKKVTKRRNAHFVVIWELEEVLGFNLDANSVRRNNVWFVKIDKESKLSRSLAEKRMFSQRKKTGRNALVFPKHVMERVIYIKNKSQSYDAEKLYEEIKEVEDYGNVISPEKAIFIVIDKDAERFYSQDMCEEHNIYYVVFDKKIKSLSKDIADGILIIDEGKIVINSESNSYFNYLKNILKIF